MLTTFFAIGCIHFRKNKTSGEYIQEMFVGRWGIESDSREGEDRRKRATTAVKDKHQSHVLLSSPMVNMKTQQ